MQNTMVRLSAEPTRTRLLITQGARDIGRAVLPTGSSAHPRAMATLLEGLSLLVGERLSVVLCVDERSTSSCGLGLLDGHDDGERSLFYEVGVAARISRRDLQREQHGLHLPGVDFRDLRQLGWGCSR